MSKYKHAPKIWTLRNLITSCDQNLCRSDKDICRPGRDKELWIPARPLGLDTLSNRLRAAWLVFQGKADAVIWPGGQ